MPVALLWTDEKRLQVKHRLSLMETRQIYWCDGIVKWSLGTSENQVAPNDCLTVDGEKLRKY